MYPRTTLLSEEKAVAAAAYLQMTDMNDQYHLGFVMGKAKPAPQAEHSIPRLELCGAALATEIGQLVAKQFDILPSKITFIADKIISIDESLVAASTGLR
jgi:hypothetical protein